MMQWIPQLGSVPLYVSAVCSFIGSCVLTPLSRTPNIPGFIMNGILLFAGCVLGNMAGSMVMFPLGATFEKPIIMSAVGMTVSGILLLMVFSRATKE